jgi:hypothetical protein
MYIVTCTTNRNEAAAAKIPQLDAGATVGGVDEDVTLELADLSAGQLSAVAALMLAFEAAETRAKRAERQLAAHSAHCICRAAEIAAEEAGTVVAFRAAA